MCFLEVVNLNNLRWMQIPLISLLQFIPIDLIYSDTLPEKTYSYGLIIYFLYIIDLSLQIMFIYYFSLRYIHQRKMSIITLNNEEFPRIHINPQSLKNLSRKEANLLNHGKSFEYFQVTQFKGKVCLFIIITRGSTSYLISINKKENFLNFILC